MRSTIDVVPLPGVHYRGEGDVLEAWHQGDTFLVTETYAAPLFGASLVRGSPNHRKARKLGVSRLRVDLGPQRSSVFMDI